MPAFLDATCDKCGQRFGWFGEVTDRPPCPRCGARISAQALAVAQANLQPDRALFDRRIDEEEPGTPGGESPWDEPEP